jgi:hypothetical protein
MQVHQYILLIVLKLHSWLSILQFWNFSLWWFVSGRATSVCYSTWCRPSNTILLRLHIPFLQSRYSTKTLHDLSIISQRLVVGWMWFEILNYMSSSCSGVTCSLFIGTTKNVSYSNVQYGIYEMNSVLSYIKLQVKWLCDLQFCVLWLIFHVLKNPCSSKCSDLYISFSLHPKCCFGTRFWE